MCAYGQPVSAQTIAWPKWQEQLKAMFSNADEFELARAIYSFHSCYDDGMTVQEAYDDFDQWTREDQ